MRADPAWTLRAGLLLAMALLSAGCASLTPPPGRGMNLRYMPHEATGPSLAGAPGEESPLTRPSPPEPEAPERLHRRRDSRETVTAAGPGRAEGNAWLSALSAQVAFLGAADEVSASSRRISRELTRLKASYQGIAGAGNGIFVGYLEYGERQRRWIDAELAAATRLATAASEVEDPDMRLALLRLAGPRLEASMLGSLLLAVWFDFLDLTDTALSRHLHGVETLYVDMERFQQMLGARDDSTLLPGARAGGGRGEGHARPGRPPHRRVRRSPRDRAQGAENIEKVLVVKESIEALTLLSALRFDRPGCCREPAPPRSAWAS